MTIDKVDEVMEQLYHTKGINRAMTDTQADGVLFGIIPYQRN